MTLADAARRLEASGAAIQALAAGADPARAAERVEPLRWSLVEVVCHLADEEREDFRARFALLAQGGDEPFAPIDPEGWVTARRYAERSLEDALGDLRAERARSVEWLTGLAASGGVDLARARTAPWGGRLAAGDVLCSWVAHDLLHLKQIARLLFDRARADAAPFSPDYAGPWTSGVSRRSGS